MGVKLLLIAPTCDGEDVGESWVAFQWAKRLSDQHDVTLLTYHKRGRRPAREQLTGMRVVEWTEPPLLGRAERLNSLLKPGYLPFYIRARRWIVDALATGEHFDIAHQPLPVALRYPSPATGLGIPLVMGPIGGGLDTPPGFRAEETAPWYMGLRATDAARLRVDPFLRATYHQAACVLGIAPYVAERLRRVGPLQRFEVMSETGLEELPGAVSREGREGLVRLLFVGRLIRTKGARDAISMMTHLRDLPVHLDIVGDGFDRPACEALASDLGLGARVTFHGAQPHDSIGRFYRDADIFVFPSYREPGGNVVFEAMGACLPLIVSDRGGPGFAVDDSCGVRVTANDPRQYASDLAAAARRLVLDGQLRREMGESSRRRVSEIGLWESKISAANRIYAETCDAQSTRAGRGERDDGNGEHHSSR
jgi:glycosyltransferase involved in cell wall biosynthesis